MMQKIKKHDGYFIGGLVSLLFASLISWTIFFIFLAFILYLIGIILVLLSKKKWWVKLITIVLPLIITFPTIPVVSDFFDL
jgi:hypothetical protein